MKNHINIPTLQNVSTGGRGYVSKRNLLYNIPLVRLGTTIPIKFVNIKAMYHQLLSLSIQPFLSPHATRHGLQPAFRAFSSCTNSRLQVPSEWHAYLQSPNWFQFPHAPDRAIARSRSMTGDAIASSVLNL